MTETTIPGSSPDPTLTPQQHRIVSLLASGHSIAKAAATEQIHRNTIGYWRRTIPAFAREFEFARREQRRYLQDQAVELAPQAMQAIEDCLTNPNSSPSLRFRAAVFIIKMATDPLQKSVKGFPTLPAEVEALSGQMLTQREESLEPVPEDAPAAPETENVDIVQSAIIPEPAQIAQSSAQTPIRVAPKPGRNEACHCGSGIKYNRCCIDKPGSEAIAQAA